jgi:hypothetical protein
MNFSFLSIDIINNNIQLEPIACLHEQINSKHTSKSQEIAVMALMSFSKKGKDEVSNLASLLPFCFCKREQAHTSFLFFSFFILFYVK